MSVHPCSRDYADALIDPFGASKDKEICLPATLLPLPSQKFKTRAIVNWKTSSTTFVGWLICAPQMTWTTDSSGSAPIHFTNDLYLGNVGTNFALSGTGIGGAFPQGPIGRPFGKNAKVRLVTFGSKTMCTTPGLNRGGKLGGVVNALHADLTGSAPTQLDNDQASCMRGFGTGELDFRVSGGGPVSPDELEFQWGDGSAPDSSILNSYFAIWCSSTVAQSFTTEMIFYWEIIGVNSATAPFLSGELSQSHSDPGPSGSANAAVASVLTNNPSHEDHGRPWMARARAALSAAWHGFQSVKPETVRSLVATAMRAAGWVASAYTGGVSLPVAHMAARAIAPKPAPTKKK